MTDRAPVARLAELRGESCPPLTAGTRVPSSGNRPAVGKRVRVEWAQRQPSGGNLSHPYSERGNCR